MHLRCMQVVYAFEQWHAQHVGLVRSLLAVRNQSSMEGPLAERLMAVLAHLRDFFRLKAAAVCSQLPVLGLSSRSCCHCLTCCAWAV